MTPPVPADIDALATRLREAAAAYYDTDAELMSDAEYDGGIETIRAFVDAEPDRAEQFADLLARVAAGQSRGGEVRHPARMGSLEKVDGREDLRAFVAGIEGPVALEPKLDGLAVRAEYDAQGRLALVATRGDGSTGDDITEAVRNLRILGLPATVDPALGLREARGEVYCADSHFADAQAVRASLGGAPFVNSRNAAAGILRKGDAAYAEILSFGAYGVELTDPPARGSEAMALAAAAGVATAAGLLPWLAPVDSGAADVDAVLAPVDRIETDRTELGFPIDGVVAKADAEPDRIRLGEGERAPKWAMAYKYPAETATTTVVGIETAVGRTGRLAIRVEVAPVFVGGTTITYASGHNVAWMLAKDVRVGDTVTIKRANDVIPYIEAVHTDARSADSQAWAPPELDPAGNEWDKSTLLWRSVSPELSVLGRITYAASRDCLDIEGIGTEIAAALVEAEHVGDVADLFRLDAETLAALSLGEGRTLGSKNAVKIEAEIQRAKGAAWNRVITALGIRLTGRTMGRRLAAAFPTADRLAAATVEDLAAVDGIGEHKAAIIRAGLDDLIERGVLARLAEAGVNMGTEPDADAQAGPLAGLTVVVSGSVPGYTRTSVAEAIEAKGGKASSSVSASTSLLVSEPSTSSKYVRAEKLGVRIVTPAQFLEMLG